MSDLIQITKFILHTLIRLYHIDKIMQCINITPDLLLFILHLGDIETTYNLLSSYVKVWIVIYDGRLVKIKFRFV